MTLAATALDRQRTAAAAAQP
eukprot:COSAG01_NODE_78485_length_145_cov_30.239130_1_plen_20_part_01